MTARVFALCLARPVADLVAAQDLPTASWSAKADIIHVILFPAPEKTRGWSAFADHDEGEERGPQRVISTGAGPKGRRRCRNGAWRSFVTFWLVGMSAIRVSLPLHALRVYGVVP